MIIVLLRLKLILIGTICIKLCLKNKVQKSPKTPMLKQCRCNLHGVNLSAVPSLGFASTFWVVLLCMESEKSLTFQKV